MRRLISLAVAALGLTAAGARADDECAHKARRDADVDARGATGVRVVAVAGSLRIEGREDLAQVRVRGEACASTVGMLEKIELVAVREGATVRVEARIPEERWGWGNARLDLALEVPSSTAVTADDGSGSAEITGVASLRMEDGSGGLQVHDVAGNVVLDDGSGDIELRNVGGEVRVEDGSGDVRAVQVGSLVVESDGSGSIDARDVRGSVRVDDDGSGSIEVEGVGGDFVVRHDGSGGIRYSDVRGTVRVPDEE
jgi:hypothetical protein